MPKQAKEDNSEIISISLPKSLVQAAAKAAKKASCSRSEVFQEALRQYLWQTEWERLQAYGMERAIELGLTPEDVPRLVDEYRQDEQRKRPRRH